MIEKFMVATQIPDVLFDDELALPDYVWWLWSSQVEESGARPVTGALRLLVPDFLPEVEGMTYMVIYGPAERNLP
jgi:hypothetical protein